MKLLLSLKLRPKKLESLSLAIEYLSLARVFISGQSLYFKPKSLSLARVFSLYLWLESLSLAIVFISGQSLYLWLVFISGKSSLMFAEKPGSLREWSILQCPSVWVGSGPCSQILDYPDKASKSQTLQLTLPSASATMEKKLSNCDASSSGDEQNPQESGRENRREM